MARRHAPGQRCASVAVAGCARSTPSSPAEGRALHWRHANFGVATRVRRRRAPTTVTRHPEATNRTLRRVGPDPRAFEGVVAPRTGGRPIRVSSVPERTERPPARLPEEAPDGAAGRSRGPAAGDAPGGAYPAPYLRYSPAADGLGSRRSPSTSSSTCCAAAPGGSCSPIRSTRARRRCCRRRIPRRARRGAICASSSRFCPSASAGPSST